jgi:hypothetical protein
VQKSLVEYLIRVSADTSGAVGKLDGLRGGLTAVAGGAVAAAVAMVGLADSIASTIDEMNTFAAASGLSIQTVEGLRVAAQYTGKDLKDLIPPELAKRIAETREGTGEAAKGFRLMGIEGRILSGELGTADEVLRASVEALSRMTDPTQRAAAATMALGEQGKQMLSAFGDVEDFDAAVNVAARLGYDVGPAGVAAMQDWQIATANLTTAFDSLKGAATPLVGTLAALVDGFATMTAGFQGAWQGLTVGEKGKAPIDSMFQGFTSGAWEFYEATHSLGAELKTVQDALGAYVTALDTVPEAAPSVFITGDETKQMDKEAKARADVSKKAAADRAKADAAEYSRVMALAAQELQTGSGVTTIKFTADIADSLTDSYGELDTITTTWLEVMATTLEDDRTAREDAAAKQAEAAKAEATRAEEDARARAQSYQQQQADPQGAMLSAIATTFAPILALAELPAALASLTATVEALPETLLSIPELVVGLLDAIGELPLAVVEMAPEIGLSLAAAIFKIFTYGFEAFANILLSVFDGLGGKIADEIAAVLRSLMGELNPFDGDGSFLGFSVAGKGKGDIFGLDVPFFETGGDVTKTGLAYVHAGERVQSVAERSKGGGQRASSPIVVNVTSNDPRVVVQEIKRVVGQFGVAGAMYGGF